MYAFVGGNIEETIDSPDGNRVKVAIEDMFGTHHHIWLKENELLYFLNYDVEEHENRESEEI